MDVRVKEFMAFSVQQRAKERERVCVCVWEKVGDDMLTTEYG